jgi:hypothetical protein
LAGFRRISFNLVQIDRNPGQDGPANVAYRVQLAEPD